MIEIIVNHREEDEATLHLRVDGRVHEECNTDDIAEGNKLIYPLEDFFDLCKSQGDDLEYDVCARCFPS